MSSRNVASHNTRNDLTTNEANLFPHCPVPTESQQRLRRLQRRVYPDLPLHEFIAYVFFAAYWYAAALYLVWYKLSAGNERYLDKIQRSSHDIYVFFPKRSLIKISPSDNFHQIKHVLEKVPPWTPFSLFSSSSAWYRDPSNYMWDLERSYLSSSWMWISCHVILTRTAKAIDPQVRSEN